MRSNLFYKLTGSVPVHLPGVYGMEVEAERFVEEGRMRDGLAFEDERLRKLAPYWRATTDGSLRHNGVEWVSLPLPVPALNDGIDLLYDAMAEELFQPSVRTGIHIHANVSTLDPLELVEVMRSYALLEPLLFRFVGVEREQNIYCVPIYRAVNEQDTWRLLAEALPKHDSSRSQLSAIMVHLRACCKYSALNLSPFLRFGTFEFRHAPTFIAGTGAKLWLRLVDYVMRARFPRGAGPDDMLSVRAFAEEHIPGLNWDAYIKELVDRGTFDFADSLLPCTYKVCDWGRPAGMAFEARPRSQQRDTLITQDEELELELNYTDDEEAA